MRDRVIRLAHLAEADSHVGAGVDVFRVDVQNTPVETDRLIVLAGIVVHVRQTREGQDVLGVLLDGRLERVQLLDDARHRLLSAGSARLARGVGGGRAAP